MHYYTYFSAAYGTGTYNDSTYQSSASTGTGTGTGTTTPVTAATTTSSEATQAQPSVLSNTGFELFAGATLACLIVFATLIIRFAKRKPSAD